MADSISQLTLGREKHTCDMHGFWWSQDGFHWSPFIETMNFSQLLNQVYLHFKQIQFELHIKNVNETNLV